MTSDHPSPDLALLRRFEPVIRYTRGERFFPLDIERYVRECSLWVQRPNEQAECLVPEGHLTLAELCAPRAHGFGAVYFLKFIEPLNIAQLAAYALSRKDGDEHFRAGRGRLARVGYGSRFVDALFSITLLARGRVPGDTAAAAALTYSRLMAERDGYRYYGRVIRNEQAGWVALQYWFFYPFNNWRSGFVGVNDHEADWEMIYVYLSESAAGDVQPEWVAYASHDFAGDDLRRRWDDPEIEKVGEHPVIYAGAGSHASYFSAGEYLAELELPFLSPLVRFTDYVQAARRKLLGQLQNDKDQPQDKSGSDFNVFRIPFVDYARGDGQSLGPGQPREWDEPGLLALTPEWVRNYRGLWGVYVRDPIAGENAPAGPMYNRDGSVRRSWYDPLGWAGLDKVPPPNQAEARVQERIEDICQQQADLARDLAQKSHELLDLGVEDAAMEGHPHLRTLHDARGEQITALSKEVSSLRARQAENAALLDALQLHAAQLKRGERGPLRTHIKRAHHPASDSGLRLSRIAEAWSAVSIGLLMVGFVFIVLFARHYLIFGLTLLITAIVFIEAGFRRQLPQLIQSVTVALAIVCALILVFEFFWETVILGVLIAGGYIMWENLRELRG